MNPYHIGFHIFQKLEKEKGLDECFFVREVHDDASALRAYLDQEDMEKLNLFEYKRQRKSGDIFVTDVSDEEGWKDVKNSLIRNTGVSGIPLIYVTDVNRKTNTIELKHEHDGRDLDLNYAEEVVKSIKRLWDGEVKLFTIVEEELWEI